ncbi:TPA: hypothetical protein ACS70L_003297 [Providencia alcalifaciens]
MSALFNKKWPINRYIFDYKIFKKKCEYCGFETNKFFIALDGEVLSNKSIKNMKTLLTINEWEAYRKNHTIIVLCHSCSVMLFRMDVKNFDLPAFKKYLSSKNKIRENTIYDYIIRLYSFDKLLTRYDILRAKTSSDEIKNLLMQNVSEKTYKNIISAYNQYIKYENETIDN